MSAWPDEFIIAYVAAVGAVIGSFLNVVIYRVPLRKSIIRPRSSCPGCSAAISWFDNIPVISWLALRGRCRSCSMKISIRYPVVEAITAILTALAVMRYGLNLVALEVVLFTWATIALGLIDFDHQLLPNVLTYPTLFMGLGISCAGGLVPLLDSVLGAIIGAAIPSMVIVIYRFIRGEDGMGWGDVKYLGAIGAVIGIHACLWVLICSSVLGALFGLLLMASGKGTSKTALPFGTFLALAALIYLYAPPAWISWSFM